VVRYPLPLPEEMVPIRPGERLPVGEGAVRVFHGPDGRIKELIFHHEERLESMRRAVSDRPKTAYEVSRVEFRGTLTKHQRCFALAETLAHLDHLVLEGWAQRIENETVVFRAA
jgi:hypothetical protein